MSPELKLAWFMVHGSWFMVHGSPSVPARLGRSMCRLQLTPGPADRIQYRTDVIAASR
jgi:hypothetical protein